MSLPVRGLDFRIHFVELAPLFRGLPAEVQAELARLARERRVARRQCFLVEGEPADEVLVLCAGRVKNTQLASDGQIVILRLTGPGEAFGALGLPSGGPYVATAQALEPSHALAWDRRLVDDLAERHPLLLKNALRILSSRVRDLEQRARELATEKVPQRLARALLRLVGSVGREAEGGVLVSLSREDLAQLVGTTLFTVSRLLCAWEADGLVRPRREGVVVDRPDRLALVAQGASFAPPRLAASGRD